MKDIFQQSYGKFTNHLEKKLDNYWEFLGYETRRLQCESFINSLNNKFNFKTLNIIETGVSQNYEDSVWGLFLGFAAELTNGKMDSVDINESYVKNSKIIFSEVIPSLKYNAYSQDSVTFLKNYHGEPNLVHLDSWDLDLKNPLPSSLHGWREFDAIKDKVPSGGIIIIDDNFRDNTSIAWTYPNGEIEHIITNYPMTGKGSLVYHYALQETSDWELIGSHYDSYRNIKIIIQKK